ncbi:filamentous hemagglutinin N-terminal domain-containing protein [Paenalcaligenes niemegkensis]|uniref:two-partner secretion domain-containing protein n=1 Tax=Paenalcaligenes niemegkensis TaxID=2895469 RepID=UPI001EE8D072|nr:filamentous hemagglutinin N-terminal domain-containing protein [Paenalcaligenes niemegkensis]MCQ9616634.1 filamentous hemagglutinin N-terminal domain-containing protein [Paenalcaligenes niemegkensis]
MSTSVASSPSISTLRQPRQRLPRLTPLASAIAVLAMAGSLAASDANAQARPFSGSWMNVKGAASGQHGANRLPHGMKPGGSAAARQQQHAREKLNRSVENLGGAAAAIAAQQAAQAAARGAAQRAPSVPDGLGKGGLDVATGELAGWTGAEGPKHTQANGKHNVAIKQTDSKAVLNWESFNVGRNTTVEFQQKPTDAVLNRVVGAGIAPSQIQGAIKADGTVMIANQNGVVFSGSSQVNVRNLVVAATDISKERFDSGLYGNLSGAQGKIEVQRGAQINTAKPASNTGGGYVLLAGKDVSNAGTITTPNGQTMLAAGDSFVIKKGLGTDNTSNPPSTTRGNEVEVTGSGTVANTGLITAATGDITLTGNNIEQAGVLLTSTSVQNRGTVHLAATGADANVTLAEGATTAILLDESATALDNQRDGMLAPAVDALPDQNIVPADPYRRDLPLVEITSNGTVDFQNGSITLATGGQVAVNAADRTLVRDGAIIDVSGAIGVNVAMESNTIKINVQGNELRDASVNRDSNPEGNNSHLSSSDVWVDVRELVLVPAGAGGYDSDRWYTAGGLLEVGGYLGTNAHSAGEWMAQGGIVSFTGSDVVTQAGSQINLSGGTLDVQDGYIRQSWLRGADGRLYEVSRAPGDLMYTGLYNGFESTSERWGNTRTFYNPLIAPRQRFEGGYTVGRDAGRLIIGTRNAVLEGDIVGDTYQGDRQNKAAQAGLDGYYQSQNAVARGAQLIVGTYTPGT